MVDPDAPRHGGVRIEGYEILERLGSGSMGVVYRARQISLDRVVAVKVLSPQRADRRASEEWFRKEARTVARLNHPNIISGIDFGESGGAWFFVMEYADGPTVAALVERGGALEEGRAVAITLQMARALEYGHRHRLVHRDVKPGNIIVAPRGVAKLCDLGLARSPLTGRGGEGQVCGTPDFMSPEQVRGGDEVDIRSDIYSLGVTLYYMLTGEVPFRGSTPSHTMAMHLTERVEDPRVHRPDLSRTTSKVVGRMTAKEPAERYPEPAELIVDLELLASELRLRDSPRPGPIALRITRTNRAKRRRRR